MVNKAKKFALSKVSKSSENKIGDTIREFGSHQSMDYDNIKEDNNPVNI